MNIRQDIQGTSPQDLNKMNENFMAMWQKVHGNIDFADGNHNMKQRIMTQWIPVQGEGNLDSSYPLEIRFYVPPNVSKIKESPFNVRSEHYRMDSSVARDNGGFASGDVALNLSGGSAIVNIESESVTSGVLGWNGAEGADNYLKPPAKSIWNTPVDAYFEWDRRGVYKAPQHNSYGFPAFEIIDGSPNGKRCVDAMSLNHVHNFSHTHKIEQTPHTHDGSVSVTIPPHFHNLNEGIKISTEQPQNVEVFVNSMKIGKTLSGINSFSNVDISPYVIIGEWNVIKVSCSNLARVVIYGIIELVNKY